MVKARVTAGRYKDEIVRISNVSLDEMGRKRAACILSDGSRANLYVSDLEILKEEKEVLPPRAKTASMPFISGSTSSRSLTHTKNMNRNRPAPQRPASPPKSEDLARCEICQSIYNREERKGQPGKLTQCSDCAIETETPMEGQMIYSHKTGATIEIKKDGELKHEAETFDPKNKV